MEQLTVNFTPSPFSKLRNTPTWLGCTRVMHIPCAPMRAVLPALCEYYVGLAGSPILNTASTLGRSRPRAARSDTTRVSSSPARNFYSMVWRTTGPKWPCRMPTSHCLACRIKAASLVCCWWLTKICAGWAGTRARTGDVATPYSCGAARCRVATARAPGWRLNKICIGQLAVSLQF